MTVPGAGSEISIHSYKHNGQLHRVWEKTLVLSATSTVIIGANDKTRVRESDGSIWTTSEPAICYFHKNYWFNIIGMLQTNGIHYYCNISSPFLFEDGVLTYTDYDLDVQVYPDMTWELLDEDEYEAHKREMNYSDSLDRVLHRHKDYLLTWIKQRQGPFSHEFIEQWYQHYADT
ncbi:DUF402 domain-containing protein [Barrientosiimonas marina]|uniref:DUF402 domain-containing protein n=1 Tax=Lentibacillus kimchii TaxID=1542911 RepID=A0ABW2URY9_9BACI